MTDDEIIDAAILRVRGGPFAPGQRVAHPSDEFTRYFVRSEGNMAVTERNGEEKRFPLAEVFDVDRAKEEAIKIELGIVEL